MRRSLGAITFEHAAIFFDEHGVCANYTLLRIDKCDVQWYQAASHAEFQHLRLWKHEKHALVFSKFVPAGKPRVMLLRRGSYLHKPAMPIDNNPRAGVFLAACNKQDYPGRNKWNKSGLNAGRDYCNLWASGCSHNSFSIRSTSSIGRPTTLEKLPSTHVTNLSAVS